MSRVVSCFLAFGMLVLTAGIRSLSAQPMPVYPVEQMKIVQNIIPLPREIGVEQKIEVKIADVGIRARHGAGDVESTAREELVNLFEEKSKVQPAGGGTGFEIVLGTLDASGTLEGTAMKEDAERLKGLKNSDQAYVIRPVGENRLIVAALQENGVFYGVQTLIQLLENRMVEDTVSIPLVTVIDWPDMKYRGVWEDPDLPLDELRLIIRYKNNVFDGTAELKVNEDGKGTATLSNETVDGLPYMEYCRRHGVKYVPTIIHLSHLARTGIYKKYPELQGKGDHAFSERISSFSAPCAAQPKFVEILADWMIDLAKLPHVDEICAWVSEDLTWCSCEKCTEAGHHVMEARAMVKAYNEVKKQYPNLQFRIYLSQGSYPMNEKILAELPKDIGAVYYDGGRSYRSDREPMIYPVLDDFAKRGGLLGVCPQWNVSWAIICPWISPQFMKFRMTEYVDKNVYLVAAYATPSLNYYEFNVTAAAEWGWNAHGRSERDFAIAWAAKKGFPDPVYAAEWIVTLGDVSWDIHGSGFPFKLMRFTKDEKSFADLLKERNAPKLGDNIFLYFPTPEKFDRNVAICDQALKMAETLGNADFIDESRIVQGQTRMLRDLYWIAEKYREYSADKTALKEELQKSLEDLTLASAQVVDAGKNWGSRHNALDKGRFRDNLLGLNAEIANTVSEVLEADGVVNPAKDKLPPVPHKKRK